MEVNKYSKAHERWSRNEISHTHKLRFRFSLHWMKLSRLHYDTLEGGVEAWGLEVEWDKRDGSLNDFSSIANLDHISIILVAGFWALIQSEVKIKKRNYSMIYLNFKLFNKNFTFIINFHKWQYNRTLLIKNSRFGHNY